MSEINKSTKNKPITHFARTFRQPTPPNMNPYFSRITNYSYSNINGHKTEKLQEIFGERDHSGYHYGEQLTRENKNGAFSERLKILEPHEIDHLSLQQYQKYQRFKENPILSIFHEPQDVFDDIFPSLPELKYRSHPAHRTNRI